MSLSVPCAKKGPYDILVQPHQNRPVIKDFLLFICLLTVCVKSLIQVDKHLCGFHRSSATADGTLAEHARSTV